MSKILCREGQCPRIATTKIESHDKKHQKTFVYYLCNKHWLRLLNLWILDKGIKPHISTKNKESKDNV